MLAGGDVREVLVGDLPSLAGKPVAHPVLSAAGVKLKILAGPGGRDEKLAKRLRYVIEGGEPLVLDRALVDESGRKVSSRSGSERRAGGPTIHFLYWPDEADAGKLRLSLKVLAGASSVEVPIALEDIPLPGDLPAPPAGSPGPTTQEVPPTTQRAPPAPAGVRVVVAHVTEKRSRDLLAKVRRDPFRKLRIGLRLAGETVEKARSYGRIRVHQAVDDKGNDLVYEDSSYIGYVPAGLRRKEGLSTGLTLWPAARAAGKIARVSGSLELVLGGKVEKLWVKDVRSLAGKQVSHEALAAAGVKLNIRKPGVYLTGEVSKNVSCEITGDLWGVQMCLLVDEKGQEVSGWSSQEHGERREVTTWILSGGEPANPGLKLTLLVGARTVKVPIELRDIPLP